jgi:Omp85 superfamily domain
MPSARGHAVALSRAMKCALIGLLISGASLWGGSQQPVLQPVEFNVNSRYTVEAVELPREVASGISRALREDLENLIGQKFNPAAMNEVARRIRDELNVRRVVPRLLRGSSPDHVKVVMDVAGKRVDLSVPQLLYESNEGLSGAVNGTLIAGDNRFTAGLISDGDELVERYTGIRTRYENRHLGSDRIRFQFEFDSYHQQWNHSTLTALGQNSDTAGLYRTRQNFEPEITIQVAKPLTVSFGTGFERFQMEVPGERDRLANAAITNVQYYQQFEGGLFDQQAVQADYNLRVATKALDSDCAYSRHRWELRYTVTRGRQSLSEDAVGGFILGPAPLFERFQLGTSSMLRGWNKWELDPLGGSRVLYNSVEYRYGLFEAFYDAGAIWDPGQDMVVRHSLGVGVRKNAFLLATAFPVRGGRVSPVFMVGMKY